VGIDDVHPSSNTARAVDRGLLEPVLQ